MSGLGMKRFKVKGIAGYGVKAGYSGCVSKTERHSVWLKQSGGKLCREMMLEGEGGRQQ